MSVYKNNTEALSQYLQSMVKLEELQKMTEDLDKELEDSQRLMSEIKSIFSNNPNGENRPPLSVELRREEMAQFGAADGPQPLQPVAEAVDVDIKTLLAGLKNEAEDLKKNLVHLEVRANQEPFDKRIENSNLEQYAASLNEISKSLASIKLNTANGNNRNTVLEMRLGQICEDVDNLTRVIQTQPKLTEANKNRMTNQDSTNALLYDNLINNLLHKINEVIYSLQNRT